MEQQKNAVIQRLDRQLAANAGHPRAFSDFTYCRNTVVEKASELGQLLSNLESSYRKLNENNTKATALTAFLERLKSEFL